MANTRQTVVIRKDLLLPEGLLAAQVAHASMEFIRAQVDANCRMGEFSGVQLEWIKEPYISVLGVNCAEDLDCIIQEAKDNGLDVHIWKDTIPSPTFPDKAIKVIVGCSIGPDDFDTIKIITNGLKLY